jgi:hypothetical protein
MASDEMGTSGSFYRNTFVRKDAAMRLFGRTGRRIEIFVHSAWAERHLYKTLLGLLLAGLVLSLSFCGAL